METSLFDLIKEKVPANVPRDMKVVKAFFANSIGMSLNRSYRVLTYPESVTNLELIKISNFTEIPCWTLIKKHGIGTQEIAPEVQKTHQRFSKVVKEKEALERQLAAA